MPLPQVIMGLFGASTALRAAYAGSHLIRPGFWQTFTKSPLIQGGTFGVGYTGGAYTGYGVTNTADPFGIHNKSYKPASKTSLGLPYGSYGRSYYRRRRYRRRYTNYGRRSRYGYRRRSYYTRYY